MKIVTFLLLLSLCAKVCCTSYAPVSSSQSGAFPTSVLNSAATKIWNVGNATDAANYDSSTTTSAAGVLASQIWFVPAATNGTSYVYSVSATGSTSSQVTISTFTASAGNSIVWGTLRKRTINNTIVGYGTDTSEASVISDTTVSSTIQVAGGSTTAAGPGYLAILSTGPDTNTAINNQVFITLVSTTATTTTLTKTADTLSTAATTLVFCTSTSYTVGNVFYDIGAGAFFYTYTKTVITLGTGSAANQCGSSSATAYTIYLGGIYLNGTAYFTSGPLPITPVTSTHAVSSLTSGNDNYINSSNIYVVYKDNTISPATTYVAKTTKSTSTSTAGSPSSLVADSTSGTQNSAASTYYTYTYTPVAVWSSGYTFGITVSCKNGSQTQTQYSLNSATFTYVYSFSNYLNSTMTVADSGLALSGNVGTVSFSGWEYNTGYSTVAAYSASATSTTYVLGIFYANGTVNSTATQGSLGSVTYNYVQFYPDVNGTIWIGWQDIDTANTATAIYTYAGYLAKLEGQIYPSSTANLLSAISIFSLLMAAIFIF